MRQTTIRLVSEPEQVAKGVVDSLLEMTMNVAALYGAGAATEDALINQEYSKVESGTDLIIRSLFNRAWAKIKLSALAKGMKKNSKTTRVQQMTNSEQPRFSVQMVNNSTKISFLNSFPIFQPSSRKYKVNPSKSNKSEVPHKQPSHSTGARAGGGAKRKRVEDSIPIKSNYKLKNTTKRIKEEKVNKISNYFSKSVGESSDAPIEVQVHVTNLRHIYKNTVDCKTPEFSEALI